MGHPRYRHCPPWSNASPPLLHCGSPWWPAQPAPKIHQKREIPLLKGPSLSAPELLTKGFCLTITFYPYFFHHTTPKWSKSQYSHHNIAIFTSCPKSATWCPKGSKMRALGPQSVPKWSQVGPKGSPGVPKVVPNVQKDHLGKFLGTQVGPKWPKCPPGLHF